MKPRLQDVSSVKAWWLPVAMSVLLLLAAGCSGSNDSGGENGADTSGTERLDADAGVEESTRKREVRLALTDWTGSRINTAIAEILIERQLGYPVTLVPVTDFGSMFGDLQDGTLDAALELWPSSLSDAETAFLDDGLVEDLGPLGPEGKVGWYVPRYVIDEYPDLRSWVGLADADTARIFATSETGVAGRLLGIDPAYEQFDEELVEALELDLTVVYAGSEEAARAELLQAFVSREPILMYWWSPTAEIDQFDLVNVALPAWSQECVDAHAAGQLMSCDYPADALFKVAFPGLQQQDPDLHSLLSQLSLSTADQIEMISAVEVDGKSISEVAAEWVDGNRPVWAAWLEPGE